MKNPQNDRIVDPDLPLIDPETLSKMWESAYNFNLEKFDILLTGITKGEISQSELDNFIRIGENLYKDPERKALVDEFIKTDLGQKCVSKLNEVLKIR